MGGITFLDYVKDLPKGKKEAKGATKGGYATGSAAAKPAAQPVATANGEAPAPVIESTSRELPAAAAGVDEEQVLAQKIAAKVMGKMVVEPRI